MIKILKYNKLIRDRIPQIIKQAGWQPTIRTLKKDEFLQALKKKVLEEAKELIGASNKKQMTDEIIDIQELLDVLASQLKLSKLEIKKNQNIKRKKRGGFKKRLFLVKQEKVT